jgi:hypothetical protein
MITRSRLWLDPTSGAHKLLVQIATVQVFLTQTLKPCVEALEQVPRGSGGSEVAALTQALTRLDRAHDDTAKGTKLVLEGLALLATDPARRKLLEELTSWLFPKGLKAAVSTPYSAEAGAGVRLSNELTDERAQTLATLPLPASEGGDLLATVKRWIALAAQIGEAEARRNATAREPQAPTRQAIHSARMAWVNAVKTLKLLVKQSKPSREDWNTIFGDLERDERS